MDNRKALQRQKSQPVKNAAKPAAFRLFAIALFITLLLSFAAAGQPGNSEADPIKQAVESYFRSFESRDVELPVRFWDQNSAELSETRTAISAAFLRVESVKFNSVRFESVRIDGEAATVEAVRDLDAFETGTRRRYRVFGSPNRIIRLVRTARGWFISEDQSAERALAVRIVDAADEAARYAELARNQRLDNDFTGTEIIEEAIRRSDRIPAQRLFDCFRFAGRVAVKFGQGERRFRETFEKALSIAEAAGDERTAAWMNLLLGVTAIDIDRSPETAIAFYEKSYSLGGRAGDAEVQARSRIRKAMILNGTGDFIAALETFREAKDLSEIAGDKAVLALALNGIGITLARIGIWSDETVASFEKSLELERELGNKGRIATVLYNIGVVHFERGDFAKAMSFYRKSIDVTGEVIFGVGINIATLYARQGNAPQALEYLRKLNPLLDDRWTSGTAAEAYFVQGDLAKAIEYYGKALSLWEAEKNVPEMVRTHLLFGEVHLKSRNHIAARKSFDRALELARSIGNELLIFLCYLDIAHLDLAESKFRDALLSTENARRSFEKLSGFAEDWRLSYAIARAHLGLGSYPAAVPHIERAIAIIEKDRATVAGGEDERQRFFDSKVDAYGLMLEVLLKRDRPSDAWVFAERAKSRVLVDILRNGRADIERLMSPDDRKTAYRLRSELAALNSGLMALRERSTPGDSGPAQLQARIERKRLELEDFLDRQLVIHPEISVQSGEFPVATLADAAALIDEDTAILEYFVDQDDLKLFVLTREGRGPITVGSYTVPVTRDQLAERVGSFRRKLASGDLGIADDGRALNDLLVKPAARSIAGKSRLIIVPDKALWDLPFQALRTGEGEYLVERAAISYAPSVTALREIAAKRRGKRPFGAELVAFGNPAIGSETTRLLTEVFMDEKFDPLPEAERLVNSLERIYGAGRSRVFTGRAASESLVKAEVSKGRVIQFAAHGILNNQAPMYSHIVLTRSGTESNEDGLLEAWEMKDLKLNADLVILSACETARGRVSNGEGVIGMTWALFIAGAPATVASQWKVESSSTTELMLEFHRQLLTGKVSKAEALRRASLKIMKIPKFRHPSYWAGWVLVGDGS